MISVAAIVALAISISPATGDGVSVPVTSVAEFAALGDDAVQDLVVLGDTRPIFLRIRVKIGDHSFRAAWAAATKSLFGRLDRNANGQLTADEAGAGGFAALIKQPKVAAAQPIGGKADSVSKESPLSVDDFTEALRGTSGPFRLQVEGLADRRTDVLFDHLDRDKDGRLNRPEMQAIVASLHRLDRDANELIDADEVNPLAVAVAASMMMGRPVRDAAIPTVLDLGPGESAVRLARMVIKKYDTGSSRGPGKRDSKVSPEEFAVPALSFSKADANRDGLLSAEELREYLTHAPHDAVLDVTMSPEASGRAVAIVRRENGKLPEGLSVRQLGEGVVEIDVGPIRLDIHIDDGGGQIEAARHALRAQFQVADSNNDGYLVPDELVGDNGQPSPLTAIFKPLDGDGDGKIYPRELVEYAAWQAAAARGRLTLTASNEGRALFGMFDLDRDRRLGAREVLDTFARISACDADKNGLVTPDEIPHHIQLTLVRGDLSALLAPPAPNGVVVGAPRAEAGLRSSRVAVGPAWFRRMDRNRDGDISRREFLGSREQFDRLDRDHDGLLAPEEAAASAPVKAPGG